MADLYEETVPQEAEESFQKIMDEAMGETAPEESTEVEEETPESPPVETDPDVERAAEHGWKPKEEWVAAGNDPDDWVGAKRWLREYDRVQEIRELRDWRKQQDEQTKRVIDHIRKQEAKKVEEYKAQLEALRADKWRAVEEGDVERARELEKREDALKPPQEETQPEAQPNPYFEEWHKSNEWYDPERNPELAIEADIFGEALLARGVHPKVVLDKVAQRFAPKQERRAPPRSPVAAPQASRQQKPKGPTFDGLDGEAKSTWREFVRLGMVKDTPEERTKYAQECVGG